MPTLIDNPEFTANEVYEIQGTDRLSGAFAGAENGGLGILNYPLQQLANRTAFLKQRQDADISNIAALQAWQALFTSTLGPNGYLKLGVNDSTLGQIAAILEWGFISVAGMTASQLKNQPLSASFPLAFPNACLFALAQWASNAGPGSNGGAGALNGAALGLEVMSPLGKSSITLFSDWDGQGTINIADPSTGRLGLTGAFWLAIGY